MIPDSPDIFNFTNRLRLTHRAGLVAISIAIFAVLAFASLQLVGPQVEVDESSFLLTAATIAGKLSNSGVNGYYSGYSLLIAPAFYLSSQPSGIFHLALILNALLVASTPFALFRLTRWTFPDIRPGWHVAAAGGATCYAAVLMLSQYTMSDSAIVPLYAWLLAFAATTMFAARVAPAVVCGVLAGFLFLVHPRGGAIAIPVVFVLLLYAKTRPNMRLLAMFMVAAACIVALAHVPLEHLAGKSASLGSAYDPDSVIGRLSHFRSWVWVGLNFFGTTTEAICASLGVFVIAIRAIFITLQTDLVPRPFSPSARACVLLSMVFGLGAALFLSAIFFVPAQRADQIAYGRYALPAVVPILAVGLLQFAGTSVARRRDARWAIAVGLVCAAVMSLAFSFLPPDITKNWNHVNAIALFLADSMIPTRNSWWSIACCFLVLSFAVYLCAWYSGRAGIAAFVTFNIVIWVIAWYSLTLTNSRVYGDDGRIVITGRELRSSANLPLCVSIGPTVDLWHAIHLRWPFYQELNHSTHDVSMPCTRTTIDTLSSAQQQPDRVAIATEHPPGTPPIGLFVDQGDSFDRWRYAHGAPPFDAYLPWPETERHASVNARECGDTVGVQVGDALPVSVEVGNASASAAWVPVDDGLYPVLLGAYAMHEGGTEHIFERRLAFPRTLRPGESQILHIVLGPFPRTGKFQARIGVVQDNVAWFSGACEVAVEVRNH